MRPLNLRIIAITMCLLVRVSAAAQQAKEPAAAEIFPEEQRGSIEFGARTFGGDVYGRPDLPFKPALATSKLNEYSDIQRNLYLRRARISLTDVLGTNNYVSYETQSSFYRNQSHLASFGQYGKFLAQFRYDEIPHTYTDTARSLYTETQPGVFTIPLIIRQGLQAASSTGTAAQINSSLPSFIATQVIQGTPFFLPQIQRKAGTGLFSYNFTPDWNMAFSFRREHEKGTRPIGSILNSSPSASASSSPGTVANRQSPGVGQELPEPIDYYFNTASATTEFGKRNWVIRLGYLGSFFSSKMSSLVFDSPFATADIPEIGRAHV